MQSMTNREYRTWQAWLSEEWNKPSRMEYYLMQIARFVHQSKKDLGLDGYKIPFDSVRKEPKSDKKSQPVSSQNILTRMSKAVWNMRIGKGDTDGD